MPLRSAVAVIPSFSNWSAAALGASSTAWLLTCTRTSARERASASRIAFTMRSWSNVFRNALVCMRASDHQLPEAPPPPKEPPPPENPPPPNEPPPPPQPPPEEPLVQPPPPPQPPERQPLPR